MAAPHFLAPLLRAPDGAATLTAEGRGPIATTLVTAFDSASRRRGLLGRTTLAEHEALIIAPSNAVHTFGMQFPIDVIYARRDGRVVKVRERLRPRRLSGAWGAFAVIELAEGVVARTGVAVGDRLVVELARGAQGPAATRS
jgi:uncharacterized membrane protein (UPF0127 family)